MKYCGVPVLRRPLCGAETGRRESMSLISSSRTGNVAVPLRTRNLLTYRRIIRAYRQTPTFRPFRPTLMEARESSIARRDRSMVMTWRPP